MSGLFSLQIFQKGFAQVASKVNSEELAAAAKAAFEKAKEVRCVVFFGL